MKWIFSATLFLCCLQAFAQESGNPFDVQTTVNAIDGRFQIHASYLVPINLCNAFAFLSDYEDAKNIPGITESKVISRSGNRVRVQRVVEEQILFIPIEIQSVIEYTETPNRQLNFEQISGDTKYYKGTWKLFPDKGKTIFRYESLVEPNSMIPNVVIEYFMKHSIRSRFEVMAERASQRKFPGNLVCD
ncbi:SRPBCC family protein [Polynucleobacter sp. MWH-Svant-W18]|uniref:SRPBCC family protein n=1 Tax=Polynucleobacter sp. MWH-Svant-W18 TaxID=1855909 RepID=UPI001BFD54A3|nr:SRPBCC family protein [Polynucleobacter sp. MWH-Svant-W18]QWD77749.1 cyclase/dehydrase [Polynucleobacter sp. MWH-Svant-W18]